MSGKNDHFPVVLWVTYLAEHLNQSERFCSHSSEAYQKILDPSFPQSIQ